MKKRIALLLALVMVLSLAACGGSGGKGGKEGGGEENGSAVGAGVSAETAVGDKITMGKLDGEALTWTAAGKGVGTVLLVSDKVLMRRAFTGEDNNSATWKDSELRAYLNGEFLDSVFTEEEKALIAPAELRTVTFDFDAYQNVIETTTDSVFLLSGSEYARYVMPIKDFKYGIPTQALVDDGVYLSDVEGSDTVTQACSWILRDNGAQEVYNIMEVSGYDGAASTYGTSKTNNSGVRPAVWAYTDKALADGWKAGTAALPADEALDAKLAGLTVGGSVTFGTAVYADPSRGAAAVFRLAAGRRTVRRGRRRDPDVGRLRSARLPQRRRVPQRPFQPLGAGKDQAEPHYHLRRLRFMGRGSRPRDRRLPVPAGPRGDGKVLPQRGGPCDHGCHLLAAQS